MIALKMMKLTTILYFCCILTLNCFKLNEGLVSKIPIQNFNEIEIYPYCTIYPAYSTSFMGRINSYNMICDDGGDEGKGVNASKFEQKDADKLILDTVIFKRFSVSSILNFGRQNYSFESLVLHDALEHRKDHFRPLEGIFYNFHFKNFIAIDTAEIHEAYFANAQKVYIENCKLYSIIPHRHTVFNYLDYSISNRTTNFTMRNSGSLKIHGSFFLDSQLVYLDLSHNEIEDFEDFYVPADGKVKVQDKLTELYLNDNLLIFIPENLLTIFPNLKVLHIHNNFINVLSSNLIEQLYKLQECFFFSTIASEKYDNTIYVTEDNKESLKNIAKRSNSPVGLKESFMSGAKYRCQEGIVTYAELEDKCKAFQNKNPNSVSFEKKQAMKGFDHFEIFAKSATVESLASYALHGTIDLKLEKLNSLKIYIEDGRVEDILQTTYYQTLRIFMSHASRKQINMILSFPESKTLDFKLGSYMKIILQNPGIFAVESTYFGETFSKMKIKHLELKGGEKGCPVEDKEYFNTLYEKFRFHVSFVKYFEAMQNQSINKYAFILPIHIDSIHLLEYFLNEQYVDGCELDKLKSGPKIEYKYFKIDMVNIWLKNNDESIEEQAKEILKYQKYFEKTPLIVTFRDDFDGDVEKFIQKQKAFQKVNPFARHFILR